MARRARPSLSWAALRSLFPDDCGIRTLAARAGYTAGRVAHWASNGCIPWDMADEFALRLGLSPERVWGEEWNLLCANDVDRSTDVGPRNEASVSHLDEA